MRVTGVIKDYITREVTRSIKKNLIQFLMIIKKIMIR